MKHTTKLTLIGSALACGTVAPQAAFAAGIELYEIATPDVGLGSAGYAARAQDASTLFKNPAGMSQLSTAQFQGGVQLTYGDVKFSPNANTSARLGTEDGGNAVGALPAMGGFYVHPIGEKVRVGLGAFSYFGLAQKYDSDWVGRYYIQEGALIGMTLMPAVSVQVTDWLSVGAGLNAMAGYFSTQVAVNRVTGPDGQLQMKDNTWGFGANAGILIEPRKGTRIGLTYLSAVDLDFQDRPSFKNPPPAFANPAKVDLGMTVPQGAMLGVYHELTEKWSLMADVGWQDWSQFGQVEVGVQSATSPNLTANLDYQDTWHAAVGTQYKASEKWLLSGGFAYDSSAVSDADRTVTTPMGQAYRFGLGAQWQVSKAINLGAAYEFIWAGDMPVDQGSDASLRGRVAGGFDNTWFSFFALNLTWNF